MSIAGPRRCYCCGKEERATGCVRGMLCGCDQSSSCQVCRYCREHCKCSEEMKADAARLRSDYHAELRKIAERNPNRINRRW